MKRCTMLVAVFALASSLSWAQGADLYKTKCAACHGAAGEGSKVNPTPLKGTKLSEADITKFLTAGTAGKKAPHAKGIAGLTDAQAKQVAGFVKGLK